MANITITLRDTPSGAVAVHSTFAPAIGQRATPAQSLALDLQREALHRAGVEADTASNLEPAHPGTPAPPECKTEAERTAYAFGWFKAMEVERIKQAKQPCNETAGKELLAVLKAYDAWADTTICIDPDLKIIRAQMRAVIAKAEAAQ